MLGLCHFVHPPRSLLLCDFLEIQSIGTRRASRMVRNHEGNNGASQKGHDKLNMTGKMSNKNDDRPVGKIPHRAGGWPNPIIVVGLPKTGTTSITRYFQCGGIERVSHWRCKDMEYCGPMIQDNVRAGRAPCTGRANLMSMVNWISRFTIAAIFHKLKLLRRFTKPTPIPHSFTTHAM